MTCADTSGQAAVKPFGPYLALIGLLDPTARRADIAKPQKIAFGPMKPMIFDSIRSNQKQPLPQPHAPDPLP
jgi:hypothetical protein